MYHRELDFDESHDTDSQAGKNRERQKIQISTGQRAYSQITAMPVILSDKSPNS
jgi:hypothetical protein